MKKLSSLPIGIIVLTLLLVVFSGINVIGGEYEALEGIQPVKAVFDVRTGKPKSAAVQLGLIHEMFRDRNITEFTDRPEFVLVFIGPAVKLVSTQTEGFPPEEQEHIQKIANIISAMHKDGIKLEICMFAANVFGVPKETVLKEIDQVHNGWISLIGYQTKGYALVPVY